jgi:DNA-binding NtrC family response regulator
MSARILVVDDEEVVIRSCLRILGDANYQVDAVRDGPAALKAVGEHGYDLLLLDIMMPKMDGVEVLRNVKASYPDLAVIMITGLPQTETAVQCMNLGAFDYLPKPFDPDELKLVVERALEKRQAQETRSQ